MPSSVALASLQNTQAPVSRTLILLPSIETNSQSPPSRFRLGRISSMTSRTRRIRSCSAERTGFSCTISVCMVMALDSSKNSAEAKNSAETLAAGAAVGGVGIFESEAGALDGDDEIDGHAGEQFARGGFDENLDAIALDQFVVFLGLLDQAHQIFVAGAAARLDFKAQALDGLGRPLDGVADSVQCAVGEMDHCRSSTDEEAFAHKISKSRARTSPKA